MRKSCLVQSYVPGFKSILKTSRMTLRFILAGYDALDLKIIYFTTRRREIEYVYFKNCSRYLRYSRQKLFIKNDLAAMDAKCAKVDWFISMSPGLNRF